MNNYNIWFNICIIEYTYVYYMKYIISYISNIYYIISIINIVVLIYNSNRI